MAALDRLRRRQSAKPRSAIILSRFERAPSTATATWQPRSSSSEGGAGAATQRFVDSQIRPLAQSALLEQRSRHLPLARSQRYGAHLLLPPGPIVESRSTEQVG